MNATTSSEVGAVLVFAVLVSVGLLALGHALLVTAEAAFLTSGARAGLVELEAAAESRLHAETDTGWWPWMDSVAAGERRTGAPNRAWGVETRGTWLRLTPEAWLVASTAHRLGRGPSVHRNRILWLYDPATRVRALPAIVGVAASSSVTGGGTIAGDTVAVGPVAAPSLGLMAPGLLLSLADTVGERGRPGPDVRSGRCRAEAMWNWGDPDGLGPCGTHVAVRGRSGSLTVDGGRGQTVLVVDGDLVLLGGARLSGMIIATGTVTLREGSSIVGRLVAYGGATVEAGSSVVGSGAVAATVLEASRRTLGVLLSMHPADRLGPG